MKWWTIFCVTIVGLFFAHVLAAAEKEDTTETVNVKSISYKTDGRESVNFQLSALLTPKIFSIAGEKPRLVVDLPGAFYGGPKVVVPGDAELVSNIRTGLHNEPAPKTRVVLDLNPEKKVAYDVATDGETLVLVLTGEDKPAAAEKQEETKPEVSVVDTPPVTAAEPAEEAPSAVEAAVEAPAVTPVVETAPEPEVEKKETPEELAAKPLDQKPVPPVFAVKSAPAKVKKIPEPTKHAELLDIKFDDSSEKGEMVLFHLNGFYPPSVTAIETDNPGVLCEFLSMNFGEGVKDTIYANGKFVERIRTERQDDAEKVKVFLDLAPNHDYDLQQVFFKTDNLFVLIVNELAPGKNGDSAAAN